jgi:Tfp pilus assembly protein PilV
MPGPLTRAEDGFTIVEVLVSAIVVVLTAMATFGAIQAAGRTASETRHRAQAYALAQQDQAAMRTMRISDLSNYSNTRQVSADGTTFTVTARGEFISDSTGTQSCSGTISADYISISSTVTWPSMGTRPPVVIKSIVSPPNGTIAPDAGALSVKATTSRNAALPGISITGTGPSTFNDTTDANGCVLFGNLPQGNYTLTPSAVGNYVDKDGNAPTPQTTSVVASSTNSITLQYDQPGTVNLSFTTRSAPNGSIVASSADTAIAFNSGMTVAKKFGTVGTRVASLALTPLFPFVSPDTFYAGACTGNNPTASAPTAPLAARSLAVPVGGSTSTSVQIPALYLTVKTGSGSSNPGSNVSNGRVTITDRNCAGTKRIFATGTNGTVADAGQTGIGLPYSAYDICADNGSRRQTANNIAVKNTNAGTSLTLYLSGSGSASGTCP